MGVKHTFRLNIVSKAVKDPPPPFSSFSLTSLYAAPNKTHFHSRWADNSAYDYVHFGEEAFNDIHGAEKCFNIEADTGETHQHFLFYPSISSGMHSEVRI